MAKKIPDVIEQWIEENPKRRNATRLSEKAGVPKSTISAILGGRKASLTSALRLANVLPRDEYLPAAIEAYPELRVFVGYLESSGEASALQLCAAGH